MILNSNSFHAKLYRWFYGTDKLPESLCPYFWKLVIAYILFIPFGILTLPYEIFSRTGDVVEDDECISYRIGSSLVLYFMLFLIVCLLSSISLFWYFNPKDRIFTNIQVGGLIAWIVIFGVVIYEFFKYLRNKWIYKSYFKEKTDNIITSFVKAKYNKYCPKITWVTNKTK
jgi:hypothetical protein